MFMQNVSPLEIFFYLKSVKWVKIEVFNFGEAASIDWSIQTPHVLIYL